MSKWLTPNLIIGGTLLIFILILFTIIVFKSLGGDNALFLIIGHIAAWGEMVVIFYFRKKPPAAPS